MYEENNRVEKIEQSSQSKWYKYLLLIGSIIVGFSFLLLSIYWIVMLISLYVELSNALFTVVTVINSVSGYFITIGIILLVIGYFGLAMVTDGIGKITLIVGAIASLLLVIVDIGMIIVNNVIVPIVFNRTGNPESIASIITIISISFLIAEFLIIATAFIIVSFTKGVIKNSNSEYRIFTISAFILPLWIVTMLIAFILGFVMQLNEIYLTIFTSAIIAFCLNQVAYTIEFSIKVMNI